MTTQSPHFNNLTPSEAERLHMLVEEAGEVIQIAGKILRHGYASYHPNDPENGNRQMLERELAHVQAVVTLMGCGGDVSPDKFEAIIAEKVEAMKRWTHHNRGLIKDSQNMSHDYTLHANVPFFRAAGGCVCQICGKTYLDHPESRSPTHQFEGAPYLHVLCDGSLVKL